MSPKSNRPKPGWCISRNDNADYIIVVNEAGSVWITTSTEEPNIYNYESDGEEEPEWDVFNLEALNDSISS